MSAFAGPRACLPQEYDVLKAALNQVFRPAGGDLTEEVPLLLDRANLENLRVTVDDHGDVRCHVGACFREAALWGRRLRVGCFGAVFTRPADQGRGLASEVLADALAVATPRCDLLMISGDRELYRRLGFAPVPAGVRFRWQGTDFAPPSPPALVRATAADVHALAALHAREPVRFERSEADWRRLLEAGYVMGWPGAVWLVGASGEPRAYVAVQDRVTATDQPMRPARVLEAAGEPEAIVAAAFALADELIAPIYAAGAFVAPFARHGILPTSRSFPISARALTMDVPVVPWLGLNYV